MATPKQAQPDREPTAAANQPPASPAAQDTKRPTDSTPMATGTFTKLPLRFGRYQVEKLLGKGAMGAVYLARDTQLERLVALKIPKLSASAKGSEKLLKRLKTEAMAAAQIDHPSVCPVFDSGDIDGTPFIAMQFIEGETLKDHLKQQVKTPQEAVALILQLAEGLAEAHSRKIYHRDLKPENIKLNRRGVPVIMDFGLAKLATTFRADASATQAGTTLGTPAYMSPEQASGKVEEIDHRSDLYALGVMLYEMLTGQWPFSGAAIHVMGQKSVLEPPSPLTVKPELDPQLAAVCHKMIAKERQNRYQTAEEVIAALKASAVVTAPPMTTSSAPPSENPETNLGDRTALEQSQAALASAIAEERQQRATSAPPASTLQTSRESILETRKSTVEALTATGPNRSAIKPRVDPKIWIGAAVGLLLAGGLVVWASGVFKTTAKDGIVVIDVNEPDAEVFVDGEKMEVRWAKGRKKATLRTIPGRREIKVAKDGFSYVSREITIAEGDANDVFNVSLEREVVDLPEEEPVAVPVENPRPKAAKPVHLKPKPQPKPKPVKLPESIAPPVATTPAVADSQPATTETAEQPSTTGNRFVAGSLWRGTRSYKKGANSGTVSYELHVREADGKKFKGHVFDTGPDKNRAEVNGEIKGNAITWRERPARKSTVVLLIEGTLLVDTIELKFTGNYGRGVTSEGVGELTRVVNP